MIKHINWILVGIFLVGIIYFSQQEFQQQDISPLIEQNQGLVMLVQKLPPIEFTYHQRVINSHQNTVAFIHFIIRKMAHVFIYGCFGLSLLRALKPLARQQLALWFIVATIVLLVAGLDELNQLYSGGRTGCPQDVILDFSGYLLFSLVYLGLTRSAKGQGL
ncbi:MAG: VanZ family protein [Syntrophomonadaceae bacterium]|nr:VanZ family protein [Syntrophomonadaceae bacterium]